MKIYMLHWFSMSSEVQPDLSFTWSRPLCESGVFSDPHIDLVLNVSNRSPPLRKSSVLGDPRIDVVLNTRMTMLPKIGEQ